MRFYRSLCLTLLVLAMAGVLGQAQKSSGYRVSRRITRGFIVQGG